MLGFVPCNSGPTVVINADKRRPKQETTSSDVHSNKSFKTVDKLGSTKLRNMGPPDSAINVCNKKINEKDLLRMMTLLNDLTKACKDHVCTGGEATSLANARRIETAVWSCCVEGAPIPPT